MAEKLDDHAKTSVPDTSRGRILIVDDEEVIAATLREFLLGEGFDVAVAGDLAGAAWPRSNRSSPRSSSATSSFPGADGITVMQIARFSFDPRPCSS